LDIVRNISISIDMQVAVDPRPILDMWLEKICKTQCIAIITYLPMLMLLLLVIIQPALVCLLPHTMCASPTCTARITKWLPRL